MMHQLNYNPQLVKINDVTYATLFTKLLSPSRKKWAFAFP